MSLKEIKNVIEEICINNLIDVEHLMINQCILINYNDENGEYVGREIETKLIVKDNIDVIKNDISYKNLYSANDSDGLSKRYYQKLNYEDFLIFENNTFISTLEELIISIADEVFEYIKIFISENYKDTAIIKHLINNIFYKRIEESLFNMNKNYDRKNNYVIYNGSCCYYDEKITAVMNAVKFRLEVILKLIRLEFNNFYEEKDNRSLDLLKNSLSNDEYKIEHFTKPSIFHNDKSYRLFKKLLKAYQKDNKRFLSNFSFTYYALIKDGFINCNQKEFIKFLASEYDIHISKIDSRQSGKDNPRYSLYNSFKSTF